jgi:cytochrome c5
VSATQPETFSPRNITVLGGLLLLAVFIGEVVIGPHHEGDMAAEIVDVADTLDEIAMRIRPVVTLDDIRNPKAMSTEGASMPATAAASDSASKTPEQLYQGSCLACHTTGAAGAPKIGDAAAWSERGAKGLDALVTSAVNGIGAMPPRGGSSYDDDQVRVVIEYILENSQ